MLVEERCRECKRVTASYDQPPRKLEGPQVLKAKILWRKGWSQRRLAAKFGVTQGWISNLQYGIFDDRIEDWKRGKIIRERATACQECMRPLDALRIARQGLREVKKWLDKN